METGEFEKYALLDNITMCDRVITIELGRDETKSYLVPN